MYKSKKKQLQFKFICTVANKNRYTDKNNQFWKVCMQQ